MPGMSHIEAPEYEHTFSGSFNHSSPSPDSTVAVTTTQPRDKIEQPVNTLRRYSSEKAIGLPPAYRCRPIPFSLGNGYGTRDNAYITCKDIDDYIQSCLLGFDFVIC